MDPRSTSSRLAALMLSLALGAMAIAGCGGDEEPPTPTGAPSDFVLSFEHIEGTVPPPFHFEWRVEFDADGAGSATYAPDYPGKGVPRYQATFEVDQSERDDLYETLSSRGTLIDLQAAENPPVGGPRDTATITARDEIYRVPAYDSGGDPPLRYLTPRIQDLVPARDWERFEREAKRYAEREYGESP